MCPWGQSSSRSSSSRVTVRVTVGAAAAEGRLSCATSRGSPVMCHRYRASRGSPVMCHRYRAPVRVVINCAFNFNAAEVSVSCELRVGAAVIGVERSTSCIPRAIVPRYGARSGTLTGCRWDEMLGFGVRMKDLPSSTTLHVMLSPYASWALG